MKRRTRKAQIRKARIPKVRNIKTDAEQLGKATTELPPLDLAFILEHVRQLIDFAVGRRNTTGRADSGEAPRRDPS